MIENLLNQKHKGKNMKDLRSNPSLAGNSVSSFCFDKKSNDLTSNNQSHVVRDIAIEENTD